MAIEEKTHVDAWALDTVIVELFDQHLLEMREDVATELEVIDFLRRNPELIVKLLQSALSKPNTKD